jgi:hypothetical protein
MKLLVSIYFVPDASIFLSVRFSHILNLCPGLGVPDEAPHPYKLTQLFHRNISSRRNWSFSWSW